MSVDKFGRHSSSQIYLEPGVSVRYVSNNFLKRDGSNDVVGDITMNNNKITSLADPVNDQDASTKTYVDTKLNKSGDSMSGTLDMNRNKITDLANPTRPYDAVNKHYVDDSVGVTLEEGSIICINQAHGIPSQQPDNNWFEEYESPTDSRDGVEVVSKTIGSERKDVIRLFYRTDRSNSGSVRILYRNPDVALAEMKSKGFTIEIKDFAFIGPEGSATQIYVGNGVNIYWIRLSLFINDQLEMLGNIVGSRNQYRDIKIEANANFGTANIYVDNVYLTRISARPSSRKIIQFFGSANPMEHVNNEIFFREIIITGSIPTGGGKRIINLGDPIHDKDVVNKRYVDSNFIKKPLITIWSQQKGSLNAGQFEWSFGAGDVSQLSGYYMPVPGRIIRGVISSINGQNASGLCTVSVVIGGNPNPQLLIKAPNAYSSIITFNPPIELSQYDRINFQTNSNAAATDNIVSLLIEVDL